MMKNLYELQLSGELDAYLSSIDTSELRTVARRLRIAGQYYGSRSAIEGAIKKLVSRRASKGKAIATHIDKSITSSESIKNCEPAWKEDPVFGAIGIQKGVCRSFGAG